ncbi:HAD-like domain-containing protein [Mycena crocata]|nr:HAD-like domain-containing protein [Mycena crocata]
MQDELMDPYADDYPMRFTWAVIRPSAVHSVAHMDSEFVTAAATKIQCGQYLALVFEVPLSKLETEWTAFLVEPVNSGHLPRTYVPIWPYTCGDREPLVPGFDWPFGECVVNTDLAPFVPESIEAGHSPHVISPTEAARFYTLFQEDRSTVALIKARERKARMTAERAADGFSGDSCSKWTTFSNKSTQIRVQPGEFFPRATGMSAEVRYDLSVVGGFANKDSWDRDATNIRRILARFSHVSAERTIRWALDIQFRFEEAIASKKEDECRLPSLDPAPPNVAYADDFPAPDSDEEDVSGGDSGLTWPEVELPRVSRLALPPPVVLGRLPEVIYLDVYGTLIDRETGIFTALRGLFERSPYQFERPEALSFYFESEAETKKRQPDAPYSQILAYAYDDVVLRLGMRSEGTDSSIFAQSIKDWPAIPAAEWCLSALRTIPSISLVAVVDVDRDSLELTTSYVSLAPHFNVVFTWDTCKAYKPAQAAVERVIKHFDALLVPRDHTCFVSNSLLDMEPVRELGVPTVWVRYEESLAGNVYYMEDESPEVALEYAGLIEFTSSFLLLANPPQEADPWEELDFDVLDEGGRGAPHQ